MLLSPASYWPLNSQHQPPLSSNWPIQWPCLIPVSPKGRERRRNLFPKCHRDISPRTAIVCFSFKRGGRPLQSCFVDFVTHVFLKTRDGGVDVSSWPRCYSSAHHRRLIGFIRRFSSSQHNNNNRSWSSFIFYFYFFIWVRSAKGPDLHYFCIPSCLRPACMYDFCIALNVTESLIETLIWV